MLDTLALALALALPPRPTLDRVPVLRAPAPVSLALLAREEEQNPVSLTTCFENRSGSCWTEE